MWALLFHVFKHLLLRKTDVLKTCRKSKFLEKKIWRNALALEGGTCGTSNYRNPVRKFAKFPFTESIKWNTPVTGKTADWMLL